MGRLTADPELRQTQSGTSLCKFSIAVDRPVRQGEEKKSDFFDCTAWGKTAEFICRYFSKGKLIHIDGRLQKDSWTDQNGQKRYNVVIVAENVSFCGDRTDNQQGGYQNQQQGNYQNQYQPNNYQQNQQGNYQPQYGNPNAQQNAANIQQQLGNLEEFEEVLSDGECPF
jgi:single-strand DNA-binding protein